MAAGTSEGRNIRLLLQPPNSPDLNVLDLGFFRNGLHQYLTPAKGIDDLVAAVQAAFDEKNDRKHHSFDVSRNLDLVVQCEEEVGNY